MNLSINNKIKRDRLNHTYIDKLRNRTLLIRLIDLQNRIWQCFDDEPQSELK